MKKFSWFLLLFLLTISLPVKTEAATEDFCDKFPLNSRCQGESSATDNNPATSTINPDNSEIIDTLTIDDVEKYLQELGYLNVEKRENNSLTFFMQGRLCVVIVVPNGKGMTISSYYPKDDKMTLEVINEWNQSLRYSYAYLYQTKDQKEYVLFETNLTVTGGVTKERIRTFFMHHGVYQSDFDNYLREL